MVSDAEGLRVEMGVSESGLDNFEEERDWERKRGGKRRSVDASRRIEVVVELLLTSSSPQQNILPLLSEPQ